MLGWVGNIERTTLENGTFRTVVFTGEQAQLTVMRLGPGEDIGREAHTATDQFIRIERGGRGSSSDGSRTDRRDVRRRRRMGDRHPGRGLARNVNTGTEDLKLYSSIPARAPRRNDPPDEGRSRSRRTFT
jgi:hypothetical protein